jgi:hypothetical protein
MLKARWGAALELKTTSHRAETQTHYRANHESCKFKVASFQNANFYFCNALLRSSFLHLRTRVSLVGRERDVTMCTVVAVGILAAFAGATNQACVTHFLRSLIALQGNAMHATQLTLISSLTTQCVAARPLASLRWNPPLQKKHTPNPSALQACIPSFWLSLSLRDGLRCMVALIKSQHTIATLLPVRNPLNLHVCHCSTLQH